MKFKQQAERYMQQIQTRRRNPVRPGTARIYQSCLDSRILPEFGETQLQYIENGKVKSFIAKLNEADLAASTVNLIFKVMKDVIASAQDANGNQLYPRIWNHEFIDLPIVSKADQDTPVVTPEQVTAACQAASGQNQALLVFLAATGVRIGEALALQAYPTLGSVWNHHRSIVEVNSTLQRGKIAPQPKTEAGRRQIDLHPDVNEWLKSAQLPTAGFLFQNSRGGPVRIETAYEQLEEVGIQGGFHALRRFRITHLEAMNVPRGLAMFWTGHAAKDVHETYIKMGQDLQTRRDWAVKAGYGFELPKLAKETK